MSVQCTRVKRMRPKSPSSTGSRPRPAVTFGKGLRAAATRYLADARSAASRGTCAVSRWALVAPSNCDPESRTYTGDSPQPGTRLTRCVTKLRAHDKVLEWYVGAVAGDHFGSGHDVYCDAAGEEPWRSQAPLSGHLRPSE
ncbi:hypothetical protein BDZ91DRAFT_765350 [Kalaharituber pfeilii]|nr:hypothetical protein BDZ91DRAFT_765350 [Kalaharituber pfeilii]